MHMHAWHVRTEVRFGLETGAGKDHELLAHNNVN